VTTSATSVSSALNTVHEKRLGMEHEGKEALFDQVFALDFGHCRLSIAAPEDDAFDGPEVSAGKRIATSYRDPVTSSRARQRHRCRDRLFLRRGGDRASARQGRFCLRPCLHRLDTRRQPAARSSHCSRQRGRRHPDPRASVAIQGRNGSSVSCNGWTACCRCARASTSCCTRRARRWPQFRAAARLRVSDGHSARGPRRQGRRACRLPRNVFWETLENLKQQAPAHCWYCRSRRCWPEAVRCMQLRSHWAIA
jgi:hypothetical protein